MSDNATLPIPFAIGEEVWWVGSHARTEWIECPECAGTLAITMIQGNGTQVSLACRCCSAGYNPPCGRISVNIYEHRPTPFTCKRVEMYGDRITYRDHMQSSGTFADAKDLFRDESECAARCAELNAEKKRFDDERAVAVLASKRRDMAWSAHYWGRQVADIKKKLAVAEARLAVCKERKADHA